jgi:hypothetical protein
MYFTCKRSTCYNRQGAKIHIIHSKNETAFLQMINTAVRKMMYTYLNICINLNDIVNAAVITANQMPKHNRILYSELKTLDPPS